MIRFQDYQDEQVTQVFKKYIHRANPSNKRVYYTLIVSHRNLIAYLVCRALQFPACAYKVLNLACGSITWITIRQDGTVLLNLCGGVHHMPQDKISYPEDEEGSGFL